MQDKEYIRAVRPSIKRIALLNLFIDEDLYETYEQEKIQFQIGQETSFKLDEEIGFFKITFFYTLATGKKLVEITVLNAFQLHGFSEFVKWFQEQNSVELKIMPDSVLLACLSSAIANTRAVLLLQLAPTVYKDKLFFPILNDEDVMRALYPAEIEIGIESLTK